MLEVVPLPFDEAQRYWDEKLPMSSSAFNALSDEAKSKAFAVSGMAKGAELETMFNAIKRAMDTGTTFADFKKDVAKIAKRRGWHTYRLQNIFQTNVQSAYMAGRYAQVKKTAKYRPYGKYSAIRDNRTRKPHLALNGKIYPLDHVFWDTWWPPNGFRCRCDVITYSEKQIKDRKLTVETEDITGTIVEPVNPVTGIKSPAIPLIPDSGFDYHPGKAAFGGLTKDVKKLGKLTPIEELKTAADLGRKQSSTVSASDCLKETDSLAEGVLKDAAGDPVIIDPETAAIPGVTESETLIDALVKAPFEVWVTPQLDESGKVRLTKRHVGFIASDDGSQVDGALVMETYMGTILNINRFDPDSFDQVDAKRLGVLLATQNVKETAK